MIIQEGCFDVIPPHCNQYVRQHRRDLRPIAQVSAT